MTEPALERLDRDACAIGAERLNLDGSRPQEFRCSCFHLDVSSLYLEYSSTTRFSLMSGKISSRSGKAFNLPCIF